MLWPCLLAAVSQDVEQKCTGQHNQSDQAGPGKTTERDAAVGFLLSPRFCVFCDFLGLTRGQAQERVPGEGQGSPASPGRYTGPVVGHFEWAVRAPVPSTATGLYLPQRSMISLLPVGQTSPGPRAPTRALCGYTPRDRSPVRTVAPRTSPPTATAQPPCGRGPVFHRHVTPCSVS